MVILKPGCLQRGLVGEVISRFEKRGLKLVAMKMVQLDEEILKVHYAHLLDRPFFPWLRDGMMAAPVILCCWEGYSAVQVVRDMAGATKASKAVPGTIRGDYSMSAQENIVHTSDSLENAEIELKRKTLCLIYNELPERMGALLLVMLASGMRLGETLKLKISDINWEGERTEITIPAEITKTKTGRTTYLTEEATEALLNYLKKRKDDDERLFPFNPESAQYYLRKVSKSLEENDIKGCEETIHWHMTRKYFISRFTLAASKDVAEHIAGHEGYLSSSYRRYTKKQILKQYIKAERKLRIFDKKKGQDGLGGI